MEEITEEERKRLKLPKDQPMVEVNGEMLLCLDEVVAPGKTMKFFPFNSLISDKQRQHMAEVNKELKKRKGQPSLPMPFNGVFPFDIFIIEFPAPPPEDEDDCK